MNKAEINSEFFNIVEDYELDITGLREFIPADNEIEAILTFYKAALDSLPDIDMSNEEEVSAAQQQLEVAIRCDFVELIDNLKLGSAIIAAGNTIALMVDSETREHVTTEMLSNTIRLHGTIEDVVVTTVPSISEIDDASDNAFGLTLKIANASISSIDQEPEPIPIGYTILLPIDSSNLKLKRQQ